MMQRKFYTADIAELGPRSVRVICSTDTVDRAGEVIVQSGIDLSAFKANPIILWSHDPAQPIGTATKIAIVDGTLQAAIEFAPEGLSKTADEICALVKAGIVKTTSIGFDDIETEPMDPKRPKGPQRYLKSQLLEVSFVSIPCNPEAEVTERALKSKDGKADEPEWKVGAATDLAIGDDDSWDGPAAAKRMLDAATGDDGEIDAAKAARGFLVYDANAAHKRGAYKLPFADLVDGKLKAMPAGIRAAASRLPDADISDEARAKAEKVLAGYKKKAGIGEDKGRSTCRTKSYGGSRAKGLYDIGSLCYLLSSLGWAQQSSRVEEVLECDDDSKLPGMLAEACRQVGAALIAMTVEEVGEMLATLDQDHAVDDDDALDDDGAVAVATATSPAVRRFRAGFYRAKAYASRTKSGRKLSAATMDCLKGILDQGDAAMEHHRNAIAAHKKCMKSLQDLVDENELQDGGEDDAGESGKGAAEPGVKSGALMTREQRIREAKALAGR